MKWIKLSNDNFQYILNKINKVCFSRRVIVGRNCIDTKTNKGTHKDKFVKIARRIKILKNNKYKRHYKLIINKQFWSVTEHIFRTDPSRGNCYTNPPIIHINMAAAMGTCLYEGDEVRFLPFGIIQIKRYPRYAERFSNIYTLLPTIKKVDRDKIIADRENEEERIDDEYFKDELEREIEEELYEDANEDVEYFDFDYYDCRDYDDFD